MDLALLSPRRESRCKMNFRRFGKVFFLFKTFLRMCFCAIYANNNYSNNNYSPHSNFLSSDSYLMGSQFILLCVTLYIIQNDNYMTASIDLR